MRIKYQSICKMKFWIWRKYPLRYQYGQLSTEYDMENMCIPCCSWDKSVKNPLLNLTLPSEEVGDHRPSTKDLIISLEEYKILNFSPLWHIVGQVTRVNGIKFKMVSELWPQGVIHRKL